MKTIREYMRENPIHGECSRCRRAVKVGKDAVACICYRCVSQIACGIDDRSPFKAPSSPQVERSGKKRVKPLKKWKGA